MSFNHIRLVFVSLCIAFTFALFAGTTHAIQIKQETETPVEYIDEPPGPQKSLGTKFYEPSDEEKPFFNQLDEGEIRTGGLSSDYDLQEHDRKNVGWLGIVREIKIDKATNTTRLLIEHKYFDGLTDVHLQAVSFNGSGDFEATLAGTDHSIAELELIKVYGIVTIDKAKKLPTIEVQFVRCWSWGSFTFITAAGEQRGSEKWRKLNKVNLDNIYSSRPDEEYYVRRLGPTKAIAKRQKIVELGRQAAVRMGADPTLLLDGSGTFTKLIGNDEFRRRAMASALQLQPQSRKFIEPIVKSLEDADYEQLGETVEAALTANMHDAVAAVLTHAFVLDDDDDTAATNALEELSYSAGKCLPALIAALRCDDEWSRHQSAEILGDVGGDAEMAIPALIILLADTSEFARSNAAEALGEIGKRPEIVVPALTLALDDTDSHVRFSVAGSLGQFGHEAKSAAPSLVKVVKDDEDDNARWHAAHALGKTGEVDVALPVLVDALDHRHAPVRRFAAMGLGELGPSAGRASPQLKKRLRDSDIGTSIAAAEALWKIEGNTKDTLPVLERALNGGFPAMWAADALQQFGPAAEPVVPALIAATKSKIGYVRSSAVKAIARIGTDAGAALPRLKELLSDEEVATRAFAAAALWMIDQDSQAIPFLLKELETESYDLSYVVQAIGMIGKPANEANHIIEKLVSDQDPFVRIAAKKTLQILNADDPK